MPITWVNQDFQVTFGERLLERDQSYVADCTDVYGDKPLFTLSFVSTVRESGRPGVYVRNPTFKAGCERIEFFFSYLRTRNIARVTVLKGGEMSQRL